MQAREAATRGAKHVVAIVAWRDRAGVGEVLGVDLWRSDLALLPELAIPPAGTILSRATLEAATWRRKLPAGAHLVPRHGAFALVFIIFWLGSGVVTLNAVLLRGQISFFQSVCVLGYCIFPLVIAAFLSLLLGVIWLKVIFVSIGFTWSTGASVGFMSELVPEDRKALGVYPVWLFYVSIAWMILIS